MTVVKCLVCHGKGGYRGLELSPTLCFGWQHYFPFLQLNGDDQFTGKCGLCQVLEQCPTCCCCLRKYKGDEWKWKMHC